MSRIIPPPATTPSQTPDDPNHSGPNGQGTATPAHKPAPTVPRPVIKPPVAGTKAPIIPRPSLRPPGQGQPAAGAKPAAPGANGAKPAAPAASGTGMPPVAELKGRPIGRVLTKMNKVTRDQIVEALDFQKKKGGALGRILIDLGYVKEVDLNLALAAQRGYELVSLEGKQITPAMIAAVPPQIATTQKVLPIEFDPASKKLVVAMASPENFRAIDDLRSLMGYEVQAVLADPEILERLINKHYQAAAESMGDLLNDLSNDETLKELGKRGESVDLATISEAADLAPVKKLINLVLLQA